jgi:hypothetical protein
VALCGEMTEPAGRTSGAELLEEAWSVALRRNVKSARPRVDLWVPIWSDVSNDIDSPLFGADPKG